MVAKRQLIYEDKEFDFFDIDNPDSPFHTFMNVLLELDGTRVTDGYVEYNLKHMFNDACYICTLALIMEHPHLHYGDYMRYVEEVPLVGRSIPFRKDSVMLMVMYLLKNTSGISDDLQRLISIIDNDMRNKSRQSDERAEKFFYACINQICSIDKKYFSKRRITPAALKDLDWEKLTGHFDIDNIKSIVRFWSDPVERNLVIDSIEAQVKVCESNDPDNLPF